MSRLMNKLKKVENNFVKNPVIPHVQGFSNALNLKKNTNKTKITAFIIVVCVVSVGVLGYFAGLQSGKGIVNIAKRNGTAENSMQNEIKSAKLTSHEGYVEKNTTLSDLKTDESVPQSKKITDDLSELVFDEEENYPEPADAPIAKNNVVSSDSIPTSNTSSTYSNDPAGGLNSGDSSKIIILTSAINKAIDIPVSLEEEENNKKTLQNLNILGVVKDETGMVALISGKEFREGDKIRQFIVDEIAKDYVVFSFKRKTYKKLIR